MLVFNKSKRTLVQSSPVSCCSFSSFSAPLLRFGQDCSLILPLGGGCFCHLFQPAHLEAILFILWDSKGQMKPSLRSPTEPQPFCSQPSSGLLFQYTVLTLSTDCCKVWSQHHRCTFCSLDPAAVDVMFNACAVLTNTNRSS